MATATMKRSTGWATAHLAGPFEVYNTSRHEHEEAQTLGRAREIAVHDSIESGCVQVLSSDRTVVGWANHGRWHGAVS